jgi:hypothetical protein
VSRVNCEKRVEVGGKKEREGSVPFSSPEMAVGSGEPPVYGQ